MVDVTFDALPSLVLKGKVVHIRPVGENSNVASVPGVVSAMIPPTEQIGDIVYRVVIALEAHDARLLWNMTRLCGFRRVPITIIG